MDCLCTFLRKPNAPLTELRALNHCGQLRGMVCVVASRFGLERQMELRNFSELPNDVIVQENELPCGTEFTILGYVSGADRQWRCYDPENCCQFRHDVFVWLDLIACGDKHVIFGFKLLRLSRIPGPGVQFFSQYEKLEITSVLGKEKCLKC